VGLGTGEALGAIGGLGFVNSLDCTEVMIASCTIVIDALADCPRAVGVTAVLTQQILVRHLATRDDINAPPLPKPERDFSENKSVTNPFPKGL
jgi:hypothetical protein